MNPNIDQIVKDTIVGTLFLFVVGGATVLIVGFFLYAPVPLAIVATILFVGYCIGYLRRNCL